MKTLTILCIFVVIAVILHEKGTSAARGRELRKIRSPTWGIPRPRHRYPWIRRRPTPRKRKSRKRLQPKKTKKTVLKKIDSSKPVSSPGKSAGPKKMKKNEYYVDPTVYEKMQKVNSMEDFIRIFKPPGYSIRKEPVGFKGGMGGIAPAGEKPDLNEFDKLGAGRPGPELIYKEVLYFESKKVADVVAADTTNPKCSLRVTYQTVPGKPGATYFPDCVALKKCGGCCKISKECVATKTANKTVQVFVLDGVNLKTVPMNFAEDVACGCGCVVKKSDCFPRQTYSESRCQCECLLTPTICPTGKHWDRGECGCICSNRQNCTSLSRKWDENTCDCVCISDPCPAGHVRNKESCICEKGTVLSSLLSIKHGAQKLQQDTITQSRFPSRSLSSTHDFFHSNDDDDHDYDDHRDDDEEEEDWK